MIDDVEAQYGLLPSLDSVDEMTALAVAVEAFDIWQILSSNEHALVERRSRST